MISQGNTLNVQGKVKYHSDSTNRSTTYTFQGAFADMSTLYNEYRLAGYTIDLEQDDADVWNLTATIATDLSNQTPDPGGGGTNEIPEVNWDLSDKTENKSILDIDNYYTNFIPNFVAKVIQEAIKNQKEEIAVNGLALYRRNNQISLATYEAGLIIYHHMAAGIKTIPVYQPILTKKAVSSKSWVINWSERNKGKIYSTDTLIQEEAVDPRLWNVLPRDVYVPSEKDDAFIPKAYGWLKGGVKSELSSHGRNIITQIWEYGLWPTLLFGNPL